MDEKGCGYNVYRLHRSDWPSEIGTYYGYQEGIGEIKVAGEGWNPLDPNDRNRYCMNPPLPLWLCPFGSAIGTSGKYVDHNGTDSTVWLVQAYEDVTVPAGTFENTMKIYEVNYDGDEIDDNIPPNYWWLDKDVRLVKAVYPDWDETVVLIGHSKP